MKWIKQRLRRQILLVCLITGLAALWLGPAARAWAQAAPGARAPAPGAVHVAEIRGIINPAVADYLERALADAAVQDAALVVVKLDTPGGLETSMRAMIQDILASPTPVAVYVTPAGARAASAGLFILAASHIAVMSPSTNTGAAHPVPLGGGDSDAVMDAKVVHDAAASIRSLMELRGRNAAWGEQAVRESVSITENEALALNVIDLVAVNLDELLLWADGRTILTTAGEVTLNVANAPLHEASMTWAEQFLHVLTNPNIAFILLSVGSIGLIAELYNPGSFFPGITGVIALILAFVALGNLPTNWAGVALIILALVLLIAELNTDGTGVLGGGALIAFLLGSIMLFRPFSPASPALPDLTVNPLVIAFSAALMAGFLALVVTQLARSRHAPIRTGYEQFIGETARVHEKLGPTGRVAFQGQLWFAELNAEPGDVAPPVPAGAQVRIVAVRGLTLIVEPL
jgi:membrane-bound serine protease (ClpP class)